MAAKEYAGKTVELDADGNLANQADWSEDIAKSLAQEEGINGLTERHWVVVNYMRKEFQTKGDAPSIRKLTKESGVDTKELYSLFPGGPAKKAARIAGLPKPKGCI
ncbi:MAG: TusE/DsrC/DsvC family sulfur relay protein [Bacteroidetes bacterium]|jgi:tRNA 2-thiouridine synthesizing protein E|nr:TusE/DsrC/DsvC family sulfur relay protein [Bacteroidota bacterium]